MTTSQQQPVELGRLDRVPVDRSRELARALELTVERERFWVGSELAEDDSRQQLRVALRDRSGLGREDDFVAAVAEVLPRDCHLGRVEVAVRQRDQDLHLRPRTSPQNGPWP